MHRVFVRRNKNVGVQLELILIFVRVQEYCIFGGIQNVTHVEKCPTQKRFQSVLPVSVQLDPIHEVSWWE